MIKNTKITIEINGTEITLSIEEARNLYSELRDLFWSQDVQPHTPIQPTYIPSSPYWEDYPGRPYWFGSPYCTSA